MSEVIPATQRVAPARTPRSTNSTKRCKKRASLANQENIPMPIITSTPMVNRNRNAPLVFSPLMDILNVTPESVANPSGTPQRIRAPQYATTLPKFEEEYSPNAVLPTGQELAMRGIFPDPFVANRRYFTTPELTQQQEVKSISSQVSAARPKKRNLALDFMEIALEEEVEKIVATTGPKDDLQNNTAIVSNRMGDQTLDKLIDAILDSARKDEKKKKPNQHKPTFNLRRRALLKNQAEMVNPDFMLSPSYAAGDDPCSDLSFMGGGVKPFMRPSTPQPASPIVVAATPTSAKPIPAQKYHDSFDLATPVRPSLKRKSNYAACQNESAKKYKMDSSSYYEVGLAMTCVYV
ncbi:uncharacterized protein [Musca autumnalis]|uniref:uncharacterized protein n=1 Tax=Musca autumnalis TaxID=221902 RepID=UPI003CEEE37A